MIKILGYVVLLAFMATSSYSQTTKLKAKITSNQEKLTIKISKDKVDQSSVLKPNIPGKNKTYHIVKSGETLSKIASKYKKSTEKIALDNKIKNSNLILVGQTLIIN